MMSDDIHKELVISIQSRFPILYVVSYEEQRVMDALEKVRVELLRRDVASPQQWEAANSQDRENWQREVDTWVQSAKRPVIYWSTTRGFRHRERLIQLDQPGQDGSYAPYNSLRRILSTAPSPDSSVELDQAIFVFQDLHLFLPQQAMLIADPRLVRILRDIAADFRRCDRTLIILSPVLNIPVELEKDVTVFDYPLPISQELDRRLEEQRPIIEENFGPGAIALSEEERRMMMQAAQGLTFEEVENVWAKALINDGKISAKDIEAIIAEKRQVILKTGLLEYYPATESFEDVGGLERLKDWLKVRAKALDSDAQGRLPPLKGVLLIGVTGCGKSLSAKAVAAEWKLPLLKLDAGKIYSATLGSSEANVRRAIKIAESLAPAVLWIDEVEKGFPKSTGAGDAGVSMRVMATFLTWMQEKKKPVFVVATANDISQMPPEFTRKGRFDEIFFVGLPNLDERRTIFRIHLQHAGLPPVSDETLDELAEQTEYFSGAEIEQMIKNALFDLHPLVGGDAEIRQALLDQIAIFVPLGRRQTEIEGVRRTLDYARSVAIPASKEALEEVQVAPGTLDRLERFRIKIASAVTGKRTPSGA